jgi:hypothetical protein
MKLVRRGLLIVFFIGLLWACLEFIRRNDAPVTVDLLVTIVETVVLWKVLVVASGIGAGVALLLAGTSILLARLETRRYRKVVRKLESEVHQLRNLPLEGGSDAGSDRMMTATNGVSGGG